MTKTIAPGRAVCGDCYHTRHTHAMAWDDRPCAVEFCGCQGWRGEPLVFRVLSNHHSKRAHGSDDISPYYYLSTATCVLDEKPLSTHPRCPECYMLYGEEHLASPLDGEECYFCVRWRTRNRQEVYA